MDRVDQIINILFQHGEININELAKLVNVSPSTIRREVLSEANGKLELYRNNVRITRVLDENEISVYRLPVSDEENRSIANCAAQLVAPGDVVGLSGGRICAEIALRLKFMKGITVVTNAINVAAELVGIRDLNLMVTGGVLNSGSFELVGDAVPRSIENIHINKFFLGTDGVSIEHGVTGHDEAEAKAAQALLEHADHTYVLADSSKFLKADFAKVCSIEDIKAIITTDKTPNEIIDKFQSAQIDYLVTHSGEQRTT